VNHPLLQIADDLERRDARVAAELARVEALQAEVEEIRRHALATGGRLDSLPQAFVAVALLHDRAEREVEAATEALRELDDDDPALDAARELLAAAERRVEEVRGHQAALEQEAQRARADAELLGRRVAALHGSVRDVDPPSDGLEGTVAWVSHARGALLVEYSGLARERDAIVREASELLGSVLGDPRVSTSVAGLRDRLQRALT
jgi:chromosome segregation ATPase